jgi:hypothetical protein
LSFSIEIPQAPIHAMPPINAIGQYTHAGKNSNAAETTNGKVMMCRYALCFLVMLVPLLGWSVLLLLPVAFQQDQTQIVME